MENEARIVNAILCQDARTEADGKPFLIGVYSGDILVQTFPAHIEFSFYLEVSGLTQENNDVKITLSVPGSRMEMDAKLVVNNIKKNAVILGPRFGLTITQAGQITLDVKINHTDSILAVEKEISLFPANQQLDVER